MSILTLRRWLMGACMAACAQLALSQALPARTSIEVQPVQLIVPFPAGGSTDVLARVLAPALSRELGRAVIVLNQPGASGIIAVRSLLSNQDPNSQVLLTPEHAPILLPLLSHDAGFNSLRDLVAVGQVAEFPFALAVPSTGHAVDLPRFVKMHQTTNSPLMFGTPVVGGAPHLVGYSLATQSNLQALPIPYQGGAPMVRDLTGGHLEAGILGVQDFAQPHRAGSVRVLAITGATRSTYLPEVPTFRELGIANLDIRSWLAFFTKSGASVEFRDAFGAALRVAVASPEARERLKSMALEAAYLDQTKSAIVFADAVAYWSALARSAHVVPQ